MNQQQKPSKIVKLTMQATGFDERTANNTLVIASAVFLLLSAFLFYRALAPEIPEGNSEPIPADEIAR